MLCESYHMYFSFQSHEQTKQNWAGLHMQKCLFFCTYSIKDNFPSKLFTCLMKTNILLIFPFACSCVHSTYLCLPLCVKIGFSFKVFHRCQTCSTTQAQPFPFIPSTTILKRLALFYLLISKKPVDMQVFHNVSKSVYFGFWTETSALRLLVHFYPSLANTG